MENDKYRIWLSGLPGITGGRKINLERQLGGAKRMYELARKTKGDLAVRLTDKEAASLHHGAQKLDPGELEERMEEKGVRILWHDDRNFPSDLKEEANCPYCLFYRGEFPDAHHYPIGIVGARICSCYGEKYAVRIGQEAAKMDMYVISGLALGIDAMGQRGALDAGGRTFAVLGSGPDICYPKSNRGLYEDIISGGGGILSEFPPGTAPAPWRFPMRNRIISALSRSLIVVEARRRSGSLITADMAMELGRDVYALPGPLDSALSEGCNRLIRQGADAIVSINDLMDDLRRAQEKYLYYKKTAADIVKADGKEETDTLTTGKNTVQMTGTGKGQEKKLERVENMVYSCLCLYPKSVHIIIEETGLTVTEVLRGLVSLEMDGLIREVGKHTYIKA